MAKNGGLKLKKRLMILAMVLLLILATCLSLVQGQSANGSTNETGIQDEVSLQESLSLGDESSRSSGITEEESAAASASSNASFNEGGPDSVSDLSYIWSVMGIETGPVIMVLEQEGENLYGQAKYEPDSGQSWNGVVVGSVKGNSVDLVLTSLRGTEQTANLLKGNIDPESQSITGDLMKVSNGQISQRGEFQALWINPDVSSYTPAIVTEPKAAIAASGLDIQNATQQAARENLPPTSLPKSYFHDVRQDADRILTGVGDISQIPIGMGGSGLS
jgi:hypothetical protein